MEIVGIINISSIMISYGIWVYSGDQWKLVGIINISSIMIYIWDLGL